MPRPNLAIESDLTRLVRALLRLVKADLLENTSLAVSVDYAGAGDDDLDVIPVATLPSLVLTGPRLREDRFYSLNEPPSTPAAEPAGAVALHPVPYTVDLEFSLTGASASTAELLNLLAATTAFLHRHRWLELDRDPADPAAGTVRYEMDPAGETRTRLGGGGEQHDLRAFVTDFVVRGFDIEDPSVLAVVPLVADPRLLIERPQN